MLPVNTSLSHIQSQASFQETSQTYIDKILTALHDEDSRESLNKIADCIKNTKLIDSTEANKILALASGIENDNLFNAAFALCDKYGLKAKNDIGNNPLMNALENNCTSNARILLSYTDNDNIDEKNNYEETALFIAAKRGNIEILPELAKKGAIIKGLTAINPNKNTCGDTEIVPVAQAAVRSGSTATVKFLIKHGVLINARSYHITRVVYRCPALQHNMMNKEKEINTPLLQGIIDNNESIVDVILKESTFENILSDEAKNGNVQTFIVNEHLSKRFRLCELSPLMHAAKRNATGCLKLLLDVENIDINSTNNYGFSAAHFAALNGHTESLILLDQYGADMDVQAIPLCDRYSIDVCNHSPLTLTMNYEYIDTTLTLINQIINFKEMPADGVESIENAIMQAALRNYSGALASLENQIDGLPQFEEARRLIQIAKTVDPDLLLHKLIETGRIRLAEWLLQVYADFNIKNERGEDINYVLLRLSKEQTIKTEANLKKNTFTLDLSKSNLTDDEKYDKMMEYAAELSRKYGVSFSMEISYDDNVAVYQSNSSIKKLDYDRLFKLVGTREMLQKLQR